MRVAECLDPRVDVCKKAKELPDEALAQPDGEIFMNVQSCEYIITHSFRDSNRNDTMTNEIVGC